MQLQTWVNKKGGPIAVAKLLGTTSPRIRAWMRRQATPKPLMMRTIVRRSHGRVSYKEIIDSTLKK